MSTAVDKLEAFVQSCIAMLVRMHVLSKLLISCAVLPV